MTEINEDTPVVDTTPEDVEMSTPLSTGGGSSNNIGQMGGLESYSNKMTKDLRVYMNKNYEKLCSRDPNITRPLAFVWWR